MVAWNGNGHHMNWIEGLHQQASAIIHHPPLGKHSTNIKSGILNNNNFMFF